jgi:hypothetical protein
MSERATPASERTQLGAAAAATKRRPPSTPAEAILALQRSAGNHRVAMLARNQGARVPRRGLLRALGRVSHAAFVIRHGTHPEIASFAASWGNTWPEATAIYDIGLLLPANFALVPQLRQRTGNDDVLLARLIQLAGGDGNAPQLNVALGMITAGGGPAVVNASLLEQIIPASGGAAALPAVTALIVAAGPPNAHNLPELIRLAGPGNLPALQSLVVATTPAYLNILAEMIRNSGGSAQMMNLRNVIARHPGATNRAVDLTRHVRGDAALFQRLAIETPLFLQAAPPAAVPPNVAVAVAAYNAARLAAVPVPPLMTLVPANFAHFMSRHTAQHFNFGEIKDDNTLWPTAWAAALAAANVEAELIAAITHLYANATWLQARAPQVVPVGGGMTAQIAARGAPAATIEVGQFFPIVNVGAGIHDRPAEQMNALAKVV